MHITTFNCIITSSPWNRANERKNLCRRNFDEREEYGARVFGVCVRYAGTHAEASISVSPLICIYEPGIIGTLLFMNPPPLIRTDLIGMNYINYINYILVGKLNLN